MDESFKDRVNSEREQLASRLQALHVFIASGAAFQSLPLAERQRLSRQLVAMRVYLDILDERRAADFS